MILLTTSLKLSAENLGLKPDEMLEATEVHGGVMLRASGQRPSMVKDNSAWVHNGSPDPGARWDHVADDVREQRIQAALKA